VSHDFGVKKGAPSAAKNTRANPNHVRVCWSVKRAGQTGSGKTYTMMGPTSDPGVNRRAIRELLQLVSSSEDLEFELHASIIEVYNENVYDLLVASRPKLNVRQLPSGVFVEHLTERAVESEVGD
jgi:kinesin family protein C2/C3